MKTTAVIMECNPFHEGHAYILERARRETDCDCLLVLMSGNYVQRGEAAVFSKQVRTRALLEHGADLVLELPLPYATGSAEYFAGGAVSILDRLHADTLVFGSETGDREALLEAARLLSREDEDFQRVLQKSLRQGLSYPAARAAALRERGLSSFAKAGPNDLLSAEYIKALLSRGSAMQVHPVRRISADSATSLRRRILEAPSSPLPALTEAQMAENTGRLSASPDLFSGPLLHALWQSASLEGGLEAYPDLTPDLANRIRALLPSYRSWSSFCALLKTRNVTYTRISRCLLKVLLDLKKEDLDRWIQAGWCGYVRVLGFRRASASCLGALERESDLHLVKKLSSPGLQDPLWLSLLQKETAADLLYHLVTEKERPVRSEYEQALVMI